MLAWLKLRVRSMAYHAVRLNRVSVSCKVNEQLCCSLVPSMKVCLLLQRELTLQASRRKSKIMDKRRVWGMRTASSSFRNGSEPTLMPAKYFEGVDGYVRCPSTLHAFCMYGRSLCVAGHIRITCDISLAAHEAAATLLEVAIRPNGSSRLCHRKGLVVVWCSILYQSS